MREREGRGEYLPLDREGEALSRAWRAVAAAAAAAYLLPKKKKVCWARLGCMKKGPRVWAG